MVPNFELRAVIDKLRCRCRFGMRDAGGQDGSEWEPDPAGCSAVLSPGDMTAHEAACTFEILSCGNVSRAARCEVEFRRSDAAAHQATCPLRPLPCNLGCGAQLAECDQAAHKSSECPRKVLHCRYEGCGASFPRADKPRHDAECMADHLAAESRARLAYMSALSALQQTQHADEAPDEQPEQVASLNRLLASGGDSAAVQAALSALMLYLATAKRKNPHFADACTAVVAAMSAHVAHAEVQATGLSCFVRLASRLKSGDAVGAAAAAALLAAMNAHPADVAVQIRACAALTAGTAPQRSMKACSNMFTSALTVGAFAPAVLAALRAHASAANLQATGLRFLELLLGRATGAIDPAMQTDAALVAVATLQHHVVHVGAAYHACALLRACNAAHLSEALRNVASDAVRAVLLAVVQHTAHKPLVANGIHALATLCCSLVFSAACCTVRVPPPGAAGSAEQCTGMQLVLRLLEEQGNASDDISHACLHAIFIVTHFPTGMQTMGGISRETHASALIRVLRAHAAALELHKETPRHAGVVISRLLCFVAATNTSGHVVDNAAGALVATAGQRTCRSPDFYAGTCTLFAHLSNNAQHRARLIDAGALGAVVAGMTKLQADSRVQKAGCEALVALCPMVAGQRQNVAQAIVAGAREAVEAAAANHAGSREVTDAAAAALAALAPPPVPVEAAAVPAPVPVPPAAA